MANSGSRVRPGWRAIWRIGGVDPYADTFTLREVRGRSKPKANKLGVKRGISKAGFEVTSWDGPVSDASVQAVSSRLVFTCDEEGSLSNILNVCWNLAGESGEGLGGTAGGFVV